MKVTDEHVHDSKALLELVNYIVKSNSMIAVTIGKLFTDRVYDNNNIFRYLSDNGVLPCIKVRKNSKVRLKKGHILRNLSVIAQRNDLQKWKNSVIYGNKWIIETVFSSINRMFDKYVYSVKLKNMIQEMMLKALLYNKTIICLNKTDSRSKVIGII